MPLVSDADLRAASTEYTAGIVLGYFQKYDNKVNVESFCRWNEKLTKKKTGHDYFVWFVNL